MTTKKIFTVVLTAVMLCCTTACEDKLDIVPLGETTLDSVDDLETLLNQVPMLYQTENQFEMLCNNMYTKWDGLPDLLANSNSVTYALVKYDETVDRVNLTTSSSLYEDLYSNINYMNVVISKAPEADGDEAKRIRIIAEAQVLRAWYHFLLVNMHAKQYDEATAAQLGGIAYVDNTNVGEQKTKLTLKEVYERILADCSDEVLAKLIQSHVDDPCRFGVDFGYGVRAKVLFQMKHYDEALHYANLALAVNGHIEDRTTVKASGNWVVNETAQNNYYLIWCDNSNLGDLYGICISPDVATRISSDDYVNKYYLSEGVNFFDHADIYGQGACESRFAQAVRMSPSVRERIILQSKCGIVPGKMHDNSREYIISSVDGILKRLQTDYLDVLLLHRPDALVEPEEVAEAFDSLHRSGKVRFFGVSNHRPSQIRLLQKYVAQPLVAD